MQINGHNDRAISGESCSPTRQEERSRLSVAQEWTLQRNLAQVVLNSILSKQCPGTWTECLTQDPWGWKRSLEQSAVRRALHSQETCRWRSPAEDF